MKSKIDSYQAACEFLKRDPKSCPDVSNIVEDDLKKYIIANFELVIITKARNLEYTQSKGLKPYRPDYSKTDWKYTPAFGVKVDPSQPSGFGFSDTDCGTWGTNASVGARLTFPTQELAIDMADDFPELHLINQLYTD